MKLRIGSGPRPFVLGLSLCLVVIASPRATQAQLAGSYHTAAGQFATYQYQSGAIEAVMLPLDVTMGFFSDNLSYALTAVIHKPIIGAKPDGTPIYPIGAEYPLTVTGTSTDGRDFDGVLLAGTQYLFDWRIEPAAGGELLWNGQVGWAGGRLETTTIADVRLVPVVVPEPAALALLSTGLLALGRRRRMSD